MPHSVRRISHATTPTKLLYTVLNRMAENGVKVELCWEDLSRDFAAVVRIKGPVLIGNFSGAYTSVHRATLKLHGHKLKRCLQRGQLPAVQYNPQTDRVCLMENAGGDDASGRASSTSTSNSGRTAPAEIGPTTATIPKPSGTSTARYSESTKTERTAVTSGRHVGMTTTTASPATPPSEPALRGNVENVEPPEGKTTTSPPSNGYLPSYLLVVDSTRKCKKLVGPSLKLICGGHAIALDLEGRRLGAKGGEILFIKVGCENVSCVPCM